MLSTLLFAAVFAQEAVVHDHGSAAAAYEIDSKATVETTEVWAAYRSELGELSAGGAGEVVLSLARVHRFAAFEERPAFTVRVFRLPQLDWDEKKATEAALARALDLALTGWFPGLERDLKRARSAKVGKLKGQRQEFELMGGPAGLWYAVDAPGDELAFLVTAADDDALNRARRDFEKAFKSLDDVEEEEVLERFTAGQWQTGETAEREAPIPDDLRQGLAAGVAWLIAEQESEGGWLIDPGTGNTNNLYGVSGLALQALVDAAPLLDEEQAALAEKAAHQAAAWMLGEAQGAATPQPGLFGKVAHGCIYNHLLCTKALLAYRARWGSAEAAPAALDAALESAVQLIRGWQKESGGWSYIAAHGVEAERWDSSISSWALLTLTAARAQGFAVDDSRLLLGAKLIDELASEETGRIGYCHWIERGGKGGLPARLASTHGQFPSHRSEALTAIGFHAQQAVYAALGRVDEDGEALGLGELAVKQVQLMLQQPPVEDTEAYDLYYWAHGSQLFAALGGPQRATWEAAAAQVMLARQTPADADKSVAGSWAPDSAWAIEGDRAYSTAQACLMLAAWARPSELKHADDSAD